jgi:hypothetical protein
VVWFDRNQDGRQDAGEWPLPGTTVRLTALAGDVAPTLRARARAQGQAQAQAPAAVSHVTTTGADGEFRFVGLLPGQYEVHAAITLAGFTRTYDDDGVADWSVQVTVVQNRDTTAHFAGLGKGALAGTVFVQGSRRPVADAIVQCRWAGYDDRMGTADDVVMTAVADHAGYFHLAHVPYGEFDCVGTDRHTGARSAPATVGVHSAALVLTALPLPGHAPPGRTGLAATGTATRPVLTVAAIALVSGLGFLLVGRRHARRH